MLETKLCDNPALLYEARDLEARGKRFDKRLEV